MALVGVSSWQHPIFNYRLIHGLADGTGFVRYDNERREGAHKHIEGLTGSGALTLYSQILVLIS